MKLRLWPLGIAALWYCTSAFAGTVSFVQITDPHIFDCKGDVDGNKEALKWCINEINGRLGPSADYRFIVVTGDLGLEGLPCGGNEREPAPAVDGKAKELADIIKESKVKQWLFLPGNNDLIGEDPEDIGTFHRFIKALKDQLPQMQIVDFCPRDGDNSSGILDIGGCRFIGFNNASFKSNDSADDAKRFEAKQSTNVDEVIARLVDPRFKSAYIFYHIPEIDDPYCISLDPTKPADNEILKKRETSRGEIGKEFPCSAWTATRLVRDKWNQVVANDRVKGLFAGHFHSAVEESYSGLSWIRSAGYAPASLLKLQVCPPVASKKQEDKQTQARGFREVSVDCEKEERKSRPIWYRKDSGQKFKIVEKDLVLSVDGNNTGSGLIHFSNPTDKEISLSLSADDFKCSNGDYGLNTKVLFALASASAAGQPVLETKLPPSATIAVKIDVGNFWEAGEATANLCNYGEPIGKLRATKWRPPFAVKVVAPVPDKPEFTFTKGKDRQVTLKNEDAMTYLVAVTAEVDGIWSAPSTVTLAPNSSAPVQLRTRDEWFPWSAGVKETVRDGNIRLQWQAPKAGNQPLPERIIPFKAHLNSSGEFRQTVWGCAFVLVCLALGGVASMLLSNWIPNRLSRADIEERLNDLASRTRDLSTCIDSGLRVFLRVERTRVHRFLNSWWALSANFPDIVKQCNDRIGVLTKQIDLATQLDRARLGLEHAMKASPIVTKVEIVDRDLQKAADFLRRSQPREEDLDAAKMLIVKSTEQISNMEQSEPAEDSTFASALSKRIESLKRDCFANESDALKELKKLSPRLFASLGVVPVKSAEILPSKYSSVDLVAAQLEVVREYLAYYGAEPNAAEPKRAEFIKYLETDTPMGLSQAKLLLKQIKETVFAEEILQAIQEGQAEISVEPTAAIQDQLVKFTVQFKEDRLNRAIAQEAIHCRWDFGDHLSETGWEAYHYFRIEEKRRLERLWTFISKVGGPRKSREEVKRVKATFGAKVANKGEPPPMSKPMEILHNVKVKEASKNPGADRNHAEYVRLAIALVIALVGLLAGAREKLATLDVIPAAFAVVLLGFGADTIKNLISPKQTETKSR